MQLDKIVTFTNAEHRLRFFLMERSLRAVGCDLPIWVIPFDDGRFQLPDNSMWWEESEITKWTIDKKLSNRKRKFQCLTTSNYQFVDTDVVFIQNPEHILAAHSGMVVCCNEWAAALTGRIVTPESLKIFQERTTMWQKSVFCSGQFACDKQLYTTKELVNTASQEQFATTCMLPPYGDQEGINLLTFLSGVTVTNLTLPPFRMESSWAGDYDSETESYWQKPDSMPYLLHYYARVHVMHEPRPVNKWFHELLTVKEQEEWIQDARVWHKSRLEFDELRASHIRVKSRMERLVARVRGATNVLLHR